MALSPKFFLLTLLLRITFSSNPLCNCDLNVVKKALTIESPTFEFVWPGYFDDSLCPNQVHQCLWDISTDIHKKTWISVEFPDFNLAENDFISIYTTHPSPVLTCTGNFCEDYESATGHVTLLLEVGQNINSTKSVGFRVQFTAHEPKCLCGESKIVLNGSQSFELQSPNFPFYYCNDIHCSYSIVAPVGHQVALNFSDFLLRDGYDKVEFFDGSSSDDPRLRLCTGNFCGQLLSSGRNLFVKFTSYPSIVVKGPRLKRSSLTDFLGFRATIKSIPGLPESRCFCGETRLELPSQGELIQLQTPNFPYSYCPNTRCAWTVVSPENSQIRVDFHSFAIAQDDSVKLYDSLRPNEGALLQSCVDFSCQAVQSSGNQMRIELFSGPQDQQQGFSAMLSAQPIYCQCRKGIRQLKLGEQIRISSPNFPYYDYCNNMQCRWTIKAPRHAVVLVKFEQFYTEFGDRVTVIDGHEHRTIQKCSGPSPCLPSVSSIDWMHVHFDSDDRITASGFKFVATAKRCDCGSRVVKVDPKLGTQTIRGPEHYCQQMRCWWSIETDPHHYLMLDFESLKLRKDDFVQVHDGIGQAGKVLRRCYGNSSFCDAVRSTDRYLHLIFYSSSTGLTNRGFLAKANSIPGSKPVQIVYGSEDAMLLVTITGSIAAAAFIFILTLIRVSRCYEQPVFV